MPNQHQNRELALMAIFVTKFGESDLSDNLLQMIKEQLQIKSIEDDSLSFELMDYVKKHAELLDSTIQSHLKNGWDIERIGIINKIILELALAEIQLKPDLSKKIIINEAIELGHKYSDEDSIKFINGVLNNFA